MMGVFAAKSTVRAACNRHRQQKKPGLAAGSGKAGPKVARLQAICERGGLVAAYGSPPAALAGATSAGTDRTH